MRFSRSIPGLAGLLVVALSASPLQAADTVIYDNTGNPVDDHYQTQAGQEAIDDLHGTESGTLTECAFEYFAPVGSGTFSATVTIYDNPGGLDAGITRVAGPYEVTGLTEGRNLVVVPIASGPEVGPDLWMGVRFSSSKVGLIRNDVPVVGASDDLYLENRGFFFFGGNPLANFGLRVTVNNAVTGVGDPLAVGLSLAPARPSPFSGSTAIAYALAAASHVRLDVLDLQGRVVATLVDDWREPGRYGSNWSGRDDSGSRIEAGLYFVRLTSNHGTRARKVVFAP